MALQNYGQNPGTYYYVNDHLGTPQQLTLLDWLVWQAAYLPYGEAQVRINLVENNLRFPGQYFDAESGLHYNWNRYYDAQTGRYISADPIGLQGGMNMYAYVNGNPVNEIDIDGLKSWRCRRPIGGRPGKFTLPGYNHAYLCATDATKGGQIVCGSQTSGHDGKGFLPGPGRPTNYNTDGTYVNEGDYYRRAACDEIRARPPIDPDYLHFPFEYSQKEFDSCLVKAITNMSRPDYAIGPFGTDCQEWSDNAINDLIYFSDHTFFNVLHVEYTCKTFF